MPYTERGAMHQIVFFPVATVKLSQRVWDEEISRFDCCLSS